MCLVSSALRFQEGVAQSGTYLLRSDKANHVNAYVPTIERLPILDCSTAYSKSSEKFGFLSLKDIRRLAARLAATMPSYGFIYLKR